jgi:ABC-type transport system substrate-binding protein
MRSIARPPKPCEGDSTSLGIVPRSEDRGSILLVFLRLFLTAAGIDTTIIVALANSPTNLDPGVGLDEASQKLHQLLYRSLLKTDANLRVVPDLASRFEPRIP